MNNIPSVTVEQMREIDRIMVEEIGVSIIMMMENASRNIAVMAGRMLGESVKDKKIVILCGKGNNGGDGLGAARHLTNFGAKVDCVLAEPVGNLRENARTQFSILQKSGVSLSDFYLDPAKREINKNTIQCAGIGPNELKLLLSQADLVIDALLGYNLKGDPHKSYATIINKANNSGKAILSVDIPSGLDGDTGEAFEPTIQATATLTLALPKVGLLTDKARGYVGELYVADLSVPKTVYKKIGIEVPIIFEEKEVVKIS